MAKEIEYYIEERHVDLWKFMLALLSAVTTGVTLGMAFYFMQSNATYPVAVLLLFTNAVCIYSMMGQAIVMIDNPVIRRKSLYAVKL
jgi:hypothetical protein